ncbi:MAG: DUF1549 domain-containing protein [Planctomycetota bacterium]|nr:MAG: DUF1549 domain-containing protein [Planctomycetota bacterium]
MNEVRFKLKTLLVFLAACCGSGAWTIARGEQPPASGVLPPLYERFAPAEGAQPASDETPDFQKHVSPLLGRLGCNGRACHGSFQGQGGFRLSLFGYDFEADYQALLEEGAGRVDLENKLDSLILTKPVDADMHEGGQRYEHGGWEYWVLRRWIEAGAPFDKQHVQQLQRLEVTPPELLFTAAGQRKPLRVVAHWSDGTAEDVTCLCRYHTNDSAVAEIDADGVVTAGDVGDTHVVVSYDNAVVPIPVLRPVSDRTGARYPEIAYGSEVDRLILEKLQKLGIVPSERCTDEEFLRRVSLDVTGTLPSPAEVLAFVQDADPQKRARKLEELLERPAYAARWTTFLCDITGNNDDQLRNFLPQSARPADQWYQWIFQRVRQNVPYDQIVEGIIAAQSRLPGESYREYCQAMTEICRDPDGEKFADRPGLVHYWARNNFRTAEERAIGVAYSFLGIRIQCAQCHKHPFDQWSKEDFDNFERLFSTVQAQQNTMAPDAKQEYEAMLKELGLGKDLRGNNLRRKLGELLREGKTVPFPELIVRPLRTNNQKRKGRGEPAEPPRAKLLGGDWVTMDQPDVRGKLMEWLRDPNNPYFAKAIVNRVWAEYFGVGIVDPPDDLSLANAPSNAALLRYLEQGFIQSGYDLKWLHRQIVLSDAYQRSWRTNETNAQDKRNFSHFTLRRLPAETTFDAVRMALIQDDYRQKIADLEMDRALTRAGASARNNGRDPESYALTVFGRSVRESNCDCDRSNEPSLLQTVFLVNDPVVQEWLSDPKTGWVAQVARKYGWELPKQRGGASSDQQRRRAEQQLKNLRNQLKPIEERLAEARERGNTRMVQQLQKRVQDVRKQIQKVAKAAGIDGGSDATDSLRGGQAGSGIAPSQARWIIETAYLRTLSRMPTEEEFVAADNYLRSEENPTQGVEALVWSLINTKEFVLNH